MSDTLDRLQQALRFIRAVMRAPGEEAYIHPDAIAEVADSLVAGIEALGGTVEDVEGPPDPILWIQDYLRDKYNVAASMDDIADVLEAWDAYDEQYGMSITFRPEIDNEE